MAAIPKKATTVILLREKEPEGFKVSLLKRHEKSSFMGGNFVYPGGRVDGGEKWFGGLFLRRILSRLETGRFLRRT